MTRVAVVSANLGAYEQSAAWPTLEAPAGVTVSVHRFTDANFPPRPLAMTSRLQCGLAKWFAHDIIQNADLYLWIDASCTPTPQAVPWFLDRLCEGGWPRDGSRPHLWRLADIAVFQHPERRSVREEYEFMVTRMARPGETYLNARYRGERLHAQYDQVAQDRAYVDDQLYASTAFLYQPTPRVRRAFEMVFSHKVRFCLHDQLVFPYALATHRVAVSVIPDNYLKCEALTFTRTGRRRVA